MKKINHVGVLIDDSGSMKRIVGDVVTNFNSIVDRLKEEERKSGIETRLSVWKFGDMMTTLFMDQPIHAIRSLYGHVTASSGNTALVQSTIEAITSFKHFKQKRADNAFLFYVLTDGEENVTPWRSDELRNMLANLDGDWTVAIFVPSEHARIQAKSYGFENGNISVWDATSSYGVEAATMSFCNSAASFYSNRTMGNKNLKSNLFTFNDVNKKDVVKKLEEINPADYQTLLVRKYDDGKEIAPFVEKMTGNPYRVGSAYYQLSKKEKIGAGKNVAVLEKSTGKLFSGVKARTLLGLPGYEVKAAPADFPLFDVFVQSTSTNRHLVADTSVIVFK